MDRIGIVGGGRVGRALEQLFAGAGEKVVCVASRREAAALEELPRLAHRLIFAVPDAAIEAVAAAVPARSGIALHTCGALGPEALRTLAVRGVACGVLHPLQTIAHGAGADSLRGVAFAVAGDPPAVEWATHIAELAGGFVIRVGEQRRALYHAAAVMASNYVTVLLDAARQLIVEAGVERDRALAALAPLVRTTVENALARGPEAALTGPIERGDAGTVAAHLGALAEAPPEIRRLYRAAGLQALAMANRRGLPAGPAAAIRALLQEDQSS